MTNDEWAEIKLKEIDEAGANIGEDYIEAVVRLKEEVQKRKDLEEIIKWAEKEVFDVRGLYTKFHTKISDYWNTERSFPPFRPF